ncbi:12579_t:CDS:2 [Rhizophagus irregularis]|nr:12579_t:CDS:2 [Rhizophagus irregularis]
MKKIGFTGRRYPSTESKPSANTKCQKCLETGHWNTPTYKARPTRTQQLTKPLKPISLELPDEFKSNGSGSDTSATSSSYSSSSESDSDSSSSGGSSSLSSRSSSSSVSYCRKRKRRGRS